MELLDDLNALGFTEYEAKVYLALLKDHPATGYQLSKQAGIPRSMVYEALGRLDVRGAGSRLRSQSDSIPAYATRRPARSAVERAPAVDGNPAPGYECPLHGAK
jgi:Cd2+/Zn2+-exporting ATPase